MMQEVRGMEDRWDILEQECSQCRECALCQTRKNVVFGVGNPQAEIMLVGEGPAPTRMSRGFPL